MSKQISATELATIVTNLLTGESSDRDSHESFQRFMTGLAQLVCNYCGGEVKSPTNRLDDTWYVGIRSNDSVPDAFGGIWREFDPEGELFGDLRSLECTLELTHEASETDPEAERVATDYRYKVFLARAIDKDGLTSSEKSENASAVLDKFFA